MKWPHFDSLLTVLLSSAHVGPVAADEGIAGCYTMADPKERYGKLSIETAENGVVKFILDLPEPFGAPLIFNTGGLRGKVVLSNGRGIYEERLDPELPGTCRVKMTLRGNQAELEDEHHYCGFGLNISASGIYKKGPSGDCVSLRD